MAMIVGHSQTKYLDNFVTCPVFSYLGFTVRDILKETLDFYNVVPSKSTVALVIGANDIGRKSVSEIAEDFKQLCQRLHTMSPSATILVSEILPRGRNLFHVQSNDRIAAETLYLDEWNAVAGLINKSLRELTKSNDWMQIISQWEFHTLFESCTCPSTARCYHIIAAMMAIGMELPEDKKVFNLTQLRRNCRPKSNKKCGTKKGRKGDNDKHVIVNAAPDSILKSEQKINTVVTPSSKITKQHDSNSDVRRSLFTYSTPKSILKTPKSSSNEQKRKLCFISPENNNKVKIPKINDLSTIEEATEMIELSDIRDDSALETENNMWIKNLTLTNDDKHIIIIDKNGKLHSQHMESVNKLLRKQFGNKIGGLQLPEKMPKFDDDKNTWTTFTPLQHSNVQLSCQIHHNHKDHWVTSIKCNNDIYLLDSLGNERPDDSLIPDGLKIQLSQIYGKNKNSVNIIIPPVQKHENSVDCGLFAIAQATSFCISQKPLLRKIFDTNKLRSHLLKCLENEEMTEFPTTKKNLSVRRIKKQKIISIELYCICNMPACLGNQVQCDKCLNWYHKHCVDAPVDISQFDVEFICSVCS